MDEKKYKLQNSKIIKDIIGSYKQYLENGQNLDLRDYVSKTLADRLIQNLQPEIHDDLYTLLCILDDLSKEDFNSISWSEENHNVEKATAI